MNKQQNKFIEKANKKHCNKYDYSKVNYINSHTEVIIICPEHGEFLQRPSTHLRCGCPKCGLERKSKKLSLTTEQFIERSKIIHNNEYDYSQTIYKNASTKVDILCQQHGIFKQLPFAHLSGQGCPYCAGKNITTEDFIKKAKLIHDEKYDYSKVNYVNNNTKVSIICAKHGEFLQSPSKHLIGQGCPYCAIEKRRHNSILPIDNFIKRANKIHQYKYDYSLVNYSSLHDKIKIICPSHGVFEQNAYDHLNGHGCNKCTIISKGEQDICQYLTNILNINIERNNRTILNGKELDIYIPDYKIAIEYNGLLWHSEKYGKDRHYHLNKTLECEKQGIKLIQIFEDEWLKHKDIVLSKIEHLLQLNKKDKIYARKCLVKVIDNKIAKDFLTKNHIQGYSAATIHLGCFTKTNELIGIMSFINNNKNNNIWTLNRFATDITKHCIGVGGKLFTYFIRNYNPEYIISFADRRWTLDKDNNLYTKLSFKLDKVLKSDYDYIVDGKTRFHKFNFRKQTLLKKYPDSGLTEDMTEYEMTQKLGFYRIWDCGLFKYVWENKS